MLEQSKNCSSIRVYEPYSSHIQIQYSINVSHESTIFALIISRWVRKFRWRSHGICFDSPYHGSYCGCSREFQKSQNNSFYFKSSYTQTILFPAGIIIFPFVFFLLIYRHLILYIRTYLNWHLCSICN